MPSLARKASVPLVAQAKPLSDLHAALATVTRVHDAKRLNLIVNDPAVFPFVKGMSDGPLDLTQIAANPANVVLLGEQGAQVYQRHQPGVWECHTQILPEGRGAWAVRFVRACLHFVFCNTDALEILTRCPNIATVALAKRIGGVFEFTNARGWVLDGKTVPADIYSLTIQRWLATAPGLAERGHWFHERLEAEFARHNRTEEAHDDDPVHDRAVGACVEMFMGGQIAKGVALYRRWAALADYEPITVINETPLAINIGSAIIIVPEDFEFWIASVPSTREPRPSDH